MVMKKYFLIVFFNSSIILCINLETSDGCKTTKFPPLTVHHPDQTFIYFNGTKILLKEKNRLTEIHPITLKFTSASVLDLHNYSYWKEGGQEKYRLYKEKIQDFCEEPCLHECVEAGPNKAFCFFNAYLIGCPLRPFNNIIFRNINLTNNCNETEPLMYIAEKRETLPTEVITKHNNFYYPSICIPSKFPTMHPFDKIIDITVNIGSRPKTFVLMVKIFGEKRNYGVCEYEIDEVINKFDAFENKPEQYISTNGAVVKDKESNWQSIIEKQAESISITNFSSVILVNRNPIYSIINFELDTEEIKHYKVIDFQDIQGKEYSIHFFATNHGRIFKGIFNKNFNEVHELFCDLDGEINDVEIWKNNRLLVLTTTKLYSLPLEMCRSMKTCAKCLRDPYCFWNKENSTCISIHVMKGNKNGNITENVEKYSKQDFSASPEVFCAYDKNSQDIAKDNEQLNKIEDYMMQIIQLQNKTAPINIEHDKQTTKLEENLLMRYGFLTNESYIRDTEKNIEILKAKIEESKQMLYWVYVIFGILILILLTTMLLLNIRFFKKYKSLRGENVVTANLSESGYFQGNDWLQRITTSSRTSEIGSLKYVSSNENFESFCEPANLEDNLLSIFNECDSVKQAPLLRNNDLVDVISLI